MTKEEIFEKIPDTFYSVMKEELKKAFPQLTFKNEDEYFMEESTSGWFKALSAAAKQTCPWLPDEWMKLMWYESDSLDDMIADKMRQMSRARGACGLIDKLEALRISDANFFGADLHKRNTYERANDMLDACLQIVYSYFKEQGTL